MGSFPIRSMGIPTGFSVVSSAEAPKSGYPMSSEGVHPVSHRIQQHIPQVTCQQLSRKSARTPAHFLESSTVLPQSRFLVNFINTPASSFTPNSLQLRVSYLQMCWALVTCPPPSSCQHPSAKLSTCQPQTVVLLPPSFLLTMASSGPGQPNKPLSTIQWATTPSSPTSSESSLEEGPWLPSLFFP